jgi:hypothetical protein
MPSQELLRTGYFPMIEDRLIAKRESRKPKNNRAVLLILYG